MSERRRASRRLTVVASLLAAALVAGCSEGVMAPASPEAERIAWIGWLMFWIAGAVMLLVLVLLAWALLRRGGEHPPRFAGIGLVVAGGIVLPLIVLPILWVVSVPVMAEIAGEDEPASIDIEVTGHRWWYEVHYPDAGVTTRDELHLPVGERVRIRVTSSDVIHSFWIPELTGKRDMTPGVFSELTIRPQRTAVYGAQCAEFCGLGHAVMTMRVVVEPREDLEAWLAALPPFTPPAASPPEAPAGSLP